MDTNEAGKDKPFVLKHLKYFVLGGAFAVFYGFVGENSLLQRCSRQHSIREMEEQIQKAQEQIRQDRHMLQILQNTDSLERFAREQYDMHAPNEVVYRVE